MCPFNKYTSTKLQEEYEIQNKNALYENKTWISVNIQKNVAHLY